MPDLKPALQKSVTEHVDAPPPEDVATLYSWANLHGAKYRDFSSSRVAAREEARQRADEAKAAELRRLEAEAELRRQEAAQVAAREAAEAAEAERLAEMARQAESERQAVLAAQEAQREAALQRGWQPEMQERGAGEQKSRTPSLEPFFAAVLSGQEHFSSQPRAAAAASRPNPQYGRERAEQVFASGLASEIGETPAALHSYRPLVEREGSQERWAGQQNPGLSWQEGLVDSARQGGAAYPGTGSSVQQSQESRREHLQPLPGGVRDGGSGSNFGQNPGPDPQSWPYPEQDPFGEMQWAEAGNGNEEDREPVSRPAWLSGEADTRRQAASGGYADRAAAMPGQAGFAGPAMQPYSSQPPSPSAHWDLAQPQAGYGWAQIPSSQPSPWISAGHAGPRTAELQFATAGSGSGRPGVGLPERGSQERGAVEHPASGWPGAGTQEFGSGASARQVPMYRQGFSTNIGSAQPSAPVYQPATGGTMMSGGGGAMAPAGRETRLVVEDTLEGSRDRIANRWYALKTVFDPQAKAEPAPVQPPAKVPVLAVFSLAGGVGKTSLVASLGRALSSRGERTLLVDTAPYGLLPFFFGARDQRPGMLRTFNPPGASAEAPVRLVTLDPDGPEPEPEAQVSGVRMHDPNADWLPSEIKRLSRGTHRVVVDLPTASGATTRRILRLGPVVLVPVAPDMNSVVSVGAIEAFFGTQNAGLPQGSTPVLPFYMLNQFDYAMPLHIDVREVLRGQIGERLLPFALRRSAAVSEALAEGMTVIDYAPNVDVAEDYAYLAEWVRSLAAPATESYRGVRWSER